MKIKSICLISLIILIVGCGEDKCVKILNDDGILLEDAEVLFKAIIEPDSSKFGALVTDLNKYYEKVIAISDSNGEVCINSHKIKSNFVEYKEPIFWVFRNKNEQVVFFDLESIPDDVVISSKENVNKINFENIEIK